MSQFIVPFCPGRTSHAVLAVFHRFFSPEEDRRFRVTVHLTSLIISHRNRSGLRDLCRTIADDYDTRRTFRIRIGRFVYATLRHEQSASCTTQVR